jgi:hypothetical protein
MQEKTITLICLLSLGLFIKLLFKVKAKSKSRQAKQHPTHIWFITSVGWVPALAIQLN